MFPNPKFFTFTPRLQSISRPYRGGDVKKYTFLGRFWGQGWEIGWAVMDVPKTDIALGEAQALLAEKYPGLSATNLVQAWVYLRDYERGLAAFASLDAPSAEDERWLGVCYLASFDDLRATEVLHRAAARGDKAAHVHLAQAYLFTERLNDVENELSKADFEALTPYDQVLYLQVKSQFEESSGSLDAALRHAEAAWGLVQGISERLLLAPQIAGRLGILYARKGRSQRALWFTERSLELSTGLQAHHAALDQVRLHTMLGLFNKAHTALRQLAQIELPPKLEVLRALRRADLAWAQDRLEQAITLYGETGNLASQVQAYFEEFQARLALATLLAYTQQAARAQEHLARASALISDPTDELHYRFRHALIQHWDSRVPMSGATLAELDQVREEFEKLGFLQEQGCLRLQLAALKQPAGAHLADLDTLKILVARLQDSAFLAPEWTLAPELKRVARRSHPELLGRAKDRLEIYTLGEEKLLLNGKNVHIPLRKATEIIAYFLERGKVSLKRLLLDVFADDEPSTARNYFHQLRHELHERLPGLHIRYLPNERLYQLESELELVWDVSELRAGHLSGEASGLFLPSSGSDWAALLEAELERVSNESELAEPN